MFGELRESQSGSMALVLVMLIGSMLIMGRFTMYMIQGPVARMMNINRQAVVETQIFSASQVAMMTAISQDNNGDCDNDTFVEPLPFRAAKDNEPHPAGGGFIPLEIGASRTDPWGSEYGYCVWNHGRINIGYGCDSDENWLYGTNRRDQPALLIVSAGQDRVFQTVCNEWDDDRPKADPQKLVDKPSGSDDIILTWTYAEATAVTGGLWNLKEDDPGTAEIKKDIEVQGVVRLTNGPVFIGGGLQLSPQTVVTTCDGTAVNHLRLNTEDSPPSIEICDYMGTGNWEKISGRGRGIETDSAGTCDAEAEGTARYNDVEKCLQICNGTDWACLAQSVCDNTPAFFPFMEQTSLGLSSLTLSNIALVTGMDAGCDVDVSVSGVDGNPEYRICDAADCSSVVQDWTTANSTLAMEGLYMQLRATTSPSVGTAFTVTGSIGTVSSNWRIVTGVTGCAPEGTICVDGTIYAGLYTDLSGVVIPMYTTRCDAGMTWDGTTCTGARGFYHWNNGNNTGYVNTSVPDGAPWDGQAYTAILIAEDSDTSIGGQQPHQAA